MSIRVDKVNDTIPVSKNKTVSGVIKQFESIKQKQYKPSLYSIHIFPFLEDNVIFTQNGVKFARCIGEQIKIEECDAKIQKHLSGQTVFVLPDYRNKILKQTTKIQTPVVQLNGDNLPHHVHNITVQEPVRYNTGDSSGVKGDDENWRDNWIDVVLSTRKKDFQTTETEQQKQQLNIEDSSLNVIFAMVIGYV